MHARLIHNPSAGRDEEIKPSLIDLLQQKGYRVDYHTIMDDNLSQTLKQQPGDLVVVAGGDGTIRRVALPLIGQNVPLAILPMGTANNICQTVGLTGPPLEVAAQLFAASAQPFDAGQITNPEHTKYFLESCGGGLFSNLLTYLAEQQEGSTGEEPTLSAEAVEMLQTFLASMQLQQWNVKLDEKDYSGEYLLVEAMNTRFLGPNLQIAPDANPGDGFLDIVFLQAEDREPFDSYLSALLRGESPLCRLTVEQAQQVTITSPPTDLHVDDDLWSKMVKSPSPPATLELKVIPNALSVLRPALND